MAFSDDKFIVAPLLPLGKSVNLLQILTTLGKS